MSDSYTPQDWHWVVGSDDERAWSSATVDWVASWPADRVTRIASEAELRDVLANAGHPRRAPGYVPQSILLWQCRATLAGIGKLDTVDAAVKQLGGAAPAAWEYSPTVSRNSPLVAQMAGLLGLTSQQVDQLFIDAATLAV